MSETSASLPSMQESGKTILASKTFWTNAVTVVATVIGWRFPVIGNFLRDNALVIVGLVGSANIGLRTVTTEPVKISVSKRF